MPHPFETAATPKGQESALPSQFWLLPFSIAVVFFLQKNSLGCWGKKIEPRKEGKKWGISVLFLNILSFCFLSSSSQNWRAYPQALSCSVPQCSLSTLQLHYTQTGVLEEKKWQNGKLTCLFSVILKFWRSSPTSLLQKNFKDFA